MKSFHAWSRHKIIEWMKWNLPTGHIWHCEKWRHNLLFEPCKLATFDGALGCMLVYLVRQLCWHERSVWNSGSSVFIRLSWLFLVREFLGHGAPFCFGCLGSRSVTTMLLLEYGIVTCWDFLFIHCKLTLNITLRLPCVSSALTIYGEFCCLAVFLMELIKLRAIYSYTSRMMQTPYSSRRLHKLSRESVLSRS